MTGSKDESSNTYSYSGLIYCEANDDCSTVSPEDGIYLNGASDNYTKSLIKCVESVCTEINLDKSKDKNAIFLSGSKIIRCIDDTNGCEIFDISTYSPSDDVPLYFINSGEEKSIIECKASSSCEAIEGKAGDIFFNGNSKENDSTNGVDDQLIVCDSTGCRTLKKDFSKTTEDQSKVEFFLNAGTYINTNKYPLIKCSYIATPSATKCEAAQPAVVNGFMINGSYSGSGKNYLIKCSSTEECNYYEAAGEVGKSEYYLNGNSNAAIDGVIKCTITSGTSNGNPCKVITLTAAADKVYINSDSERLIQCSTTSSKCLAIDGLGTGDDDKAFYVNGDAPTSPTSYENLIIECGEKCSIVNGKENNIYINSNLKVSGSNANGIANKPLIICKSDKTCVEDVATASAFYVNSGKESAEDYSGLIISCTATANAACTLAEDVAKDNIYLNGNSSNDATHKLIVCSNNACEPSEVTFASGETKKYFVNSGGTAPLTDIVLECSSGATGACSPITPGISASVTELIYINGNYDVDGTNYLIKCNSEGCTPYASEEFIGGAVSATTKEHYINGAVTTTVLTDSVIEVSFESNKSKRLDGNESPSFKAKITLLTPNAGEMYINNSDKNLIQCKTTCKATKTLVGDGETSTYFVNGDPTISSNEFKDRLIQCSGEGTCEPLQGKENGIYINGNFYVSSTNGDGEANKRLIVCSAKKCQSINDSGNVAYFVNAASSQDDLSDALINCSSNKNDACTVVEGNGNDIYMNGNFKADSTSFTDATNYLIVCDESKCQVRVGKTKKDNDYYVNASQTGLTNALIKCSTEKCELKNISSSFSTTVKELFFINGNYGEDKDAVNYIIKCESTTPGCTAAASESPTEMEHYVHGDSTGFDDSVIEVTFSSGEEANNQKRSTTVTATSKFAENVKAGSIFINSSPTTKLIQCYTKNSKDSCEAYAGGGTDDIPNYYVNAAVTTPSEGAKLLIECTADECLEIEAEEKGIYLNSNLKSNSNTNGIENVPLIVCSSDGCLPSNSNLEENGDEYFINSGQYIETDTKALIKCTKSGTTITCGAEKAIENGIYINGADIFQIIICTTEETCSLVATAPTDKKSEYYINSVDATSESIILCHKSDGCQIVKEELDNKVFINGNYGEGRDTENQLITCPAGKCGLIKNEAGEIPEYYVNGDTTNTEYLKDDLIKCVKEESKVTCTEFNAGKDDIYLNGNFESSQKQIIVCKGVDENPEDEVDEGSCIETKVEVAEGKTKYYVNAGADKDAEDKLKDTLIQCKDSTAPCTVLDTVEDSDIYIDANTEQLIYCSKEKGCEAKESQANKDNNEFYINANDATPDLQNDLIKCQLDEATNEKKCTEVDSKPDYVYIDGYTKGNIIYCSDENGCHSKPSFSEEEKGELPKFFVNGDDIDFNKDGKDKDPLNGDLIKCTKSVTGETSKITCIITKGDNNNVYINSNYSKEDGDEINQLIICTEEEGCVAKSCSSSTASINDDPDEADPTLERRQEIESEEQEVEQITEDSSDASEKFPKYYINSGNANKLEKGIIECTASDVACSLKTAEANQVYKNSNDNETLHPIIKCGKSGCKTAESLATENNNEYYKNAGDGNENPLEYDIIECSYDDTNSQVTCTELKEVNEGVYLNSNYVESGDNQQLIQCSKDNGCVGLRSESTSKDGEYYVNAEASTITNAIILCINKKCEKQTPAALPSFYVGYMKEEIDGLIQCTNKDKACEFKSAVPFSGYYLNSGYNKMQNQTIICDSSDGCTTLKVDLGYYINAGNASKTIIKCEKEGMECTTSESPKCPEAKDAIPGNYCYEEDQLKFFPSTNSTSISATKSDDIYTFASIPDGGFPGIRRETGSLFKISRYFINRFYQSGIVMIDKNGKLVDNLSSDQSDINLYDCNDSTKICTERPGCTSNTYMYDSENKKAVFCNNSKLEYVDFNGYVVDSNRAVGTNHPYIIHCENGKCKSERPKTTSYYENSGYDATSNALIQCTNNNCVTVSAEVGYYVGHDGKGIIQCTSTTSCVFNSIKTKVKYVNSGSDKTSNAIIDCSKNGCSANKAKIGYYLTYSSNILIQCTSPSSCVEFTPTVNYYDNADSSEGSNTIINCVQTSQVITCALEQTNNGFYMSSVPNVLIRCKSGSKCKTVTVKNGIFRGALKGLTGSSKRSEDDDEIELEEDNDGMGMSVAMPRDTDDAYGIIRCVAGKCSALSPSEVASIPVCEFNNNKCYITLEYAMTKSATTSISAGNICTNADRSIFYFATDTIVVKPNVISGVTATYVYTTTNSNCLEVNDAYTDMYFTVGSNIYLLDQGSVLQFYESGYYFINTSKNTLVSGNDIDAYNDENVKLYKCNGSSCSITDKPDSLSYYVDVNKRILKYNVNSDAYSFAYAKDITCIFTNNKCTPNADLTNREFCVTYKGELVLAKQDIKNRETGECYKASSITNTIYGYSQYLYNMNIYSAQMVDETGYYIVNLSTNTTVVSKNYKTKNNNLVVYGCQLSSCKEYTPDDNTYYYDARAKTILRYHDGIWSTPETSGYAYISLDPTTTYIYRFTKKLDEIKINAMANYGYYYTVDGEMYRCNQEEDGGCTPISNTGYYFTNAGEVYYCVHDSEELEPTECIKQACVSGQYYYIDDAYYRCEVSSMLVPVVSRYCSYNENVVINFPLALTEEYPEKIKQAVEGIEKNNNSTAIVTRRGKNYLESVSGVFTNCTYNVEETKSTFDLVCINNYVAVDKDTDDVKICSMEQLGYVECIEDEENPEKCNVSSGLTRLSLSLLSIILATLLSVLIIKS